MKSQPSIAIREVTPSDFKSVTTLLASTYLPYKNLWGDPPWWDHYFAELCDVEKRSAESIILVAETPDEATNGDTCIIGCVTLLLSGPTAFVKYLAVDGDHRRRGTAKALISELETRATGRGATEIALQTTPVMVEAISLYESSGYSRSAEHDYDDGTFIMYGFTKGLSV